MKHRQYSVSRSQTSLLTGFICTVNILLKDITQIKRAVIIKTKHFYNKQLNAH